MIEAAKMETAANGFVRVVGASGGLAGEIRMNVSEGFAAHWLMPRLIPFQRAHPEIKFKWHAFNSGRLDQAREVDVALLWERPDDPEVVCRRLGKVKLSLFAYPAYVQQHGMLTSLDELPRHTLIHHTAYDTYTAFDSWNRRIRELPGVVRYENSMLAEPLVRQGGAMALLPDYVVNSAPDSVRMPVETGVSLELWLVFHEDRKGIPRIRLLAEEIYRLARESKGKWLL